MKPNSFMKQYLAILLSVAMLAGLVPHPVFAGESGAESEMKNAEEASIEERIESNEAEEDDKKEAVDEIEASDEEQTDDLDYVNANNAEISFQNTTPDRSFDIQEIDYWRSCQKFGLSYQSKWEGVAPYAPLFGHYVKNGRETRPIGNTKWGNNDWMTGYLMVDIPSFGSLGTEGLTEDEYGLATIGVVRVDDKYSRTNDFNTWSERITEAFKEYNGNAGFGENGYSNSDVDQSTKLVIWDGYKRVQGFNRVTKKEYVKSVEEVEISSTAGRQFFANYVKKHLENGAKIHGFITVAEGLKHIYEPTWIPYRRGESQIIKIPQIKITALTYDVLFEHQNAPEGAELPQTVSVKVGEKLEIPKIKDYKYAVFDKNGNTYDLDKGIEKNLDLIISWNKEGTLPDSDQDNAPDLLEDLFKTDKSKTDTDGDGVSDVTEILLSHYFDPLNFDTDGNGISDGDEDSDKDGLINRLEEINKTDPIAKDSDYDGLPDGDEVNVYKTDPGKKDTDSDGVNDKDEIDFKTDPLVPNQQFKIDYTQKDEAESVEVNVKLTLPPEQANTLSIEKVESKLFFPETMPGYMGSAYDFQVDGSFDEATISFKFDPESIDGDAEPTIYYFNEEKQELEPLETRIEAGVASTKVNHFSTYILINRKVFEAFSIWNDNWIDVQSDDSKYKNLEFVLVIDNCGSLEVNDPTGIILDLPKDIIDKLPAHSKIGIVKFATEYTILTPGLIEDRATAKKSLNYYLLESFQEYKMFTAINAAFSLFKSNDEKTLKSIILISDGMTDDGNLLNAVIQKAKSENIIIHTIGLGEDSPFFESDVLPEINLHLKPLSEKTGGHFYLASERTRLYEILKDINIKIDITTDSDNDGVPDYYEENLPLFNGTKLSLDKNNPDTDNDGLKDGEEIELRYTYNENKTKVNVRGRIKTDPSNNDTDFDGIGDEEEYFIGTDPNHKDTDRDKLTDGLEFSLGFDPLKKDPDKDGRSDFQEYVEETDPYFYNKTWKEHLGEFVKGALAGDFIQETNSLAVTAGQIVGSCIPGIDIRDVVANLYHGDYTFAGISVLGLVPGAGDAGKAATKAGKFILKNINDLPKVVEMLEFLSKNFPDIGKHLGKTDTFVQAVKQITQEKFVQLTKKQQKILLEHIDEASVVVSRTSNKFNIRKTIDSGGAWDKSSLECGNLLDEALNFHSSPDGLARNFPVIDRREGRTIVSTKSIDITAKSYQNPSKLKAKIKRYLNDLDNFESKFNKEDGLEWAGKIVTENDYDKKALEIVLPDAIIDDDTIKILEELIAEYEGKIDIWFIIAK